MHNVTLAARAALANATTYAIYARHAEVELTPLPEGVTVVTLDPRACGCRSDECYFCAALDDAVWGAAWREEQAEWEEKYAVWED